MNKKTFLTISVLGFVLIYILIFIIYGFITFYSWSDSGYDLTKAGQFGDMFGAINAFFTGLAFIGLVATNYSSYYTKKSNDKKHYITILKSTTEELKYNIRRIDECINAYSDNLTSLKTNQNIYGTPTFSFYPDFLEKMKYEFCLISENQEIINKIFDCEFELKHVRGRLEKSNDDIDILRTKASLTPIESNNSITAITRFIEMLKIVKNLYNETISKISIELQNSKY